MPLYNQETNHTLPSLALTIIDVCTHWVEIVPLQNKHSEDEALANDRTWLSHYTRLFEAIHDNVTEFSGEFIELHLCGIKSKSTTIKNPQANAMLERMHQVLANHLRTLELENRHLDDIEPFAGVIPNTAFAQCATVHTTLKASPAQLAFGPDMIIHTQFVADWASIRERQHQDSTKDNICENSNRLHHH